MLIDTQKQSAVIGKAVILKNVSVDAIYDRYAYFDEKAVALSEWHGFLQGLLRREFGDVDWVAFYGRRMEAVTPDEPDDN